MAHVRVCGTCGKMLMPGQRECSECVGLVNCLFCDGLAVMQQSIMFSGTVNVGALTVSDLPASRTEHYAECRTCRAQGPHAYDRETARQYWNQRAVPRE